MAKIIGDHVGTTWSDFLVLPGSPADGNIPIPEDIDISTDLGGIKLNVPFLTAAMRSITGKDMALAAGKLGMMGVAPRGLTVQKQVEVIKYVKDNAVRPGEIESVESPTILYDTDTVGTVIRTVKRTGHNNIPIVTRKSDFLGIFQYKPSVHDSMDFNTGITKAIHAYGNEGEGSIRACKGDMDNGEIKAHLKGNNLRFVPVIDDSGRLDKLVFLQKSDAYRVGAAIDTHPGWEKRAEKLIAAGTDMIFVDTSDAHKPFSGAVVKKYKKIFGNGPPICGGNVVTSSGFDYLVEAGTDIVKLGMGPGSICSTNAVLGVGAPPLWSLIEVVNRRDRYFQETGKYVPVIADGGIEGTNDINVALTHADAIMGAKIFGCFLESEGDRVDISGNMYPKGTFLNEGKIIAIKEYGEASKEAMETAGDMKRYTTPLSKKDVATFQGVSGWLQYRGRLKPGVEGYIRTLKEAIYHAGAHDLGAYRKNACLVRLSERAKKTADPHGIKVIED